MPNQSRGLTKGTIKGKAFRTKVWASRAGNEALAWQESCGTLRTFVGLTPYCFSSPFELVFPRTPADRQPYGKTTTASDMNLPGPVAILNDGDGRIGSNLNNQRTCLIIEI
jgi:hypothetical protein